MTMNGQMDRHVLVFGGNGFVGAETVRQLLKCNITHITAVNRGKSTEWDSGAVMCQTTHFKHDRKSPLSSSPDLLDHIQSTMFSAVIDFSAYDDRPIRHAIKHVHGRCGVYIYISSDSVYEVCDKTHAGPSLESDATRPGCKRRRRLLAKEDAYGDGKLRAEEYLVEQSHLPDGESIPYVILRLTDVIGPRDSTDRWWQCQLYVHVAKAIKQAVQLPKDLIAKKLSFVFVKDVAAVVCSIVVMDTDRRNGVIDDCYNLAFTETTTMQAIYEAIQNGAALGGITFQTIKKSDHLTQMYPSVEKGTVDVTKASLKLGWDGIVTPLDSALEETIQFYEDTRQYVDECRDVLDTMLDDFSFMCERKQLKHILKEILHL